MSCSLLICVPVEITKYMYIRRQGFRIFYTGPRAQGSRIFYIGSPAIQSREKMLTFSLCPWNVQDFSLNTTQFSRQTRLKTMQKGHTF
jgi:hypothetical protein